MRPHVDALRDTFTQFAEAQLTTEEHARLALGQTGATAEAAEAYFTAIQPDLAKASASLLAAGNAWRSASARLDALAQSEDPEARDVLRRGLAHQRSAAARHAQTARTVVDATRRFCVHPGVQSGEGNETVPTSLHDAASALKDAAQSHADAWAAWHDALDEVHRAVAAGTSPDDLWAALSSATMGWERTRQVARDAQRQNT